MNGNREDGERVVVMNGVRKGEEEEEGRKAGEEKGKGKEEQEEGVSTKWGCLLVEDEIEEGECEGDEEIEGEGGDGEGESEDESDDELPGFSLLFHFSPLLIY